MLKAFRKQMNTQWKNCILILKNIQSETDNKIRLPIMKELFQALGKEDVQSVTNLVEKSRYYIETWYGEYSGENILTGLISGTDTYNDKSATILINSGINLDLTNLRYETPLHIAARANNFDIVKLLIEKGANLNSRDYYGNTPLHNAAYEGHSNIVKELVNYGADIHILNYADIPAIFFAAMQAHSKIVQLLLDSGARIEVDSQRLPDALPLVKDFETTKLIMQNSQIDFNVKKLYARSSNNSENDYDYYYGLLKATKDGNLAQVQYLIKHGVDPHNLYNGSNDLDDTKSLILQIAANREQDAKLSLLHIAADRGHVALVKYLIKDVHIDPNIVSKQGYSPLGLLVCQVLKNQHFSSKHLEVVKELLKCSGSLNIEKYVLKAFTEVHKYLTYDEIANIIEESISYVPTRQLPVVEVTLKNFINLNILTPIQASHLDLKLHTRQENYYQNWLEKSGICHKPSGKYIDNKDNPLTNLAPDILKLIGVHINDEIDRSDQYLLSIDEMLHSELIYKDTINVTGTDNYTCLIQ